ncbi:SIR2 family NAD-dependent protein deacylase [Actinoplanes awajinensis]|uniref:NAD-dependent protein deacetylase of SIR2 family n=1 Tax=Actinoplanes awajinensis subsp. mycoplanecinus TaxID=135947 RepID=A0A124G8E7_9ACTN|nr:NAD-dependent protein deacetylase of SIR2 family [Actinoplanes awajinensis]KUL25675.1 NAD-dependent protein deacetylase of SIR2 family [Actinoplanes awajinensis subsp. mycoplanecinus]
MSETAVDLVRRWLAEADRIVIGAGAGLSAAAGYDYTDTRRFAELFPALHRRGLRARYQLIGARLPAPLMWGYWATHVADIRFGAGGHPVYERLRAVVGDRDHFVLSSNVDGLFTRNGFEPGRVFTPQGDYARYQCEIPCTRETWDSRPIVEAALAAYDPATGEVTDPAAIPACPRCGGEVFLNVRKGPEYLVDPYLATGRRMREWLAGPASGERLVVLDIGTGFNTPGVVRLPMERLAQAHPGARLIRINRDHPEVPAQLGDRAIGLAVGAETVFAGDQNARG